MYIYIRIEETDFKCHLQRSLLGESFIHEILELLKEGGYFFIEKF